MSLLPRYQKGKYSPKTINMCLTLDSVKTAKWIGDCFIYTTVSNRLNYFVGTESYTITPFDQYVIFDIRRCNA